MGIIVSRLWVCCDVNHVVLLAMEDSNNAILKLQQYHNTLFKCLRVTAEKLGTWSFEDVDRNLQGGILTNDINHHILPRAFREIQDALAQPRVYRVCTVSGHIV